MRLVRIVAPWFVAGVVLEDGRVVRAAPIMAYMRGWTAERVHGYARHRGWEACDVRVCRDERRERGDRYGR